MAEFSSKNPLERVLDIISLERQDIYLLLALTFGYGLLGVAMPVAVQALVNLVTMGGVLQPLYIVSVMLFFLLALSGVLYLLEIYIVELISRRIYLRVTLQAGKSVQGMRTEIYDANNPVELMNRYFEISTAQKSAATLLTSGLTAILQGFVGGIILMFYNIYFIGIVVLVALMLAGIVFVLGMYAYPTAKKESNVKYATAAWLESIARNNYLFKFFNAKQRVEELTDIYSKDFLDKRKAHFKILFVQNAGAVFIYAAIGTAMLAVGGSLVIQGQINLGQFVAAELIIFGVLSATVGFVKNLESYYDLLVAYDKMGVIHDFPQEATGTYFPTTHTYTQLEVRDLSFAYTDRIAPIEGLGFVLNKGESLAVLGASGAGKSTLIALLAGLRLPSRGRVTAEGTDLRQLDMCHYRNRIGMVSKVEFVEDSILENLTLGRAEVTLDKVQRVLIALNLDEDIALLALGLDTPVTAFGAPLSSTQAQRLMFARAVLGSPDILMVDGLLDALSQQELKSVLTLFEQIKQQCMLIVATRREEVAQQFDQVLSLGRRVEEQ